jgi:predicted HicB family RNase H-like nuclease
MLKNMMEYKGMVAKVGLDMEDRVFNGEVIGARTALHFTGRTYDELTECFHTAVDEYFQFCQEEGITPEKTWKGKLTFRPRSDELRQRIWIQATSNSMSVNEWMNNVVEKELHSSAFAH